MKIYIISLERDVNRRKKIRQTFPSHWENFTWIHAIDAANPESKKTIQEYFKKPSSKTKSFTLGEKCCAMSHIKCLQQFLLTEDPACIIIEDDLEGIDRDFIEALKETRKLGDSSVVILGGQQGLKNAKHLSGKRISENLWEIPKTSTPFITRACCYGITRNAATKIIESQNTAQNRSDNWEHYSTLGIKIYYSNIFKHPVNLRDSHLEAQRAKTGFLRKIIEDGTARIIYRILCKLALSLMIGTKIYERVRIK
jgi:glycosyl transferase family 25|tara:strand:+ start:1450 stop:2211 length:762 start_codon:yes stop_codon:yes gene_type:complete